MKTVKGHPSLLPQREHEKTKTRFASKDEYEKRLYEIQLDLLRVQQFVHRGRHKLVLLFEGPDAAGKGGLIKRLTQFMDPRGVQVHPIGKPNDIEAGEHYLQRFMARLPQPGMITVFDRSWYGRVLVERVEELCPPEAWRRAYGEINFLEKALQNDGILILKYLLDLTYDEQKERFKERRRDPLKSWKLTDEDERNRRKWNEYYLAYREMLKRTATDECPWRVVAADSKWHARVSILEDIEARARRVFAKDERSKLAKVRRSR